MEYKSNITKRSVAKILNILQNKLQRMISDMTEHSPEEINRALSNPAAEKVLKRRITDGSIELVNSDT